jgi:hypothetical protein
MISEIIIYSTVASAATAAGILGMPYLDRAIRSKGFRSGGLVPQPEAEPVDLGPKDLSNPHIRERMTAFLHNHDIVGDADVRGGKFFPPVPPSKLEPLAIVMRRAWDQVMRLKNPASCSLYIRDSVNDRFMLLDELDVMDIGEILRVVERVAEDRRKSRSLYKGMTDDEIHSLVTASLSRWLKEHGEFEKAHAVMGGDERDFVRDIAIATAALELAFQVKKAER